MKVPSRARLMRHPGGLLSLDVPSLCVAVGGGGGGTHHTRTSGSAGLPVLSAVLFSSLNSSVST